jgi:hypothetical protein
MDTIFDPTSLFDFAKLSLAQPTSIQGNAYFTKFEYNSGKLYIETPSCITKQGFIKNGKKIYTDLMFSNADSEFITWVENLETTCQTLLFGNSKTWFTENLELSDIESAFTPSLKIFKSGKYYLLRVFANPKGTTKYYDDNECLINSEDINENSNNISIIEFLGIKFTNRTFQIEVELKQMMLLKVDKIFEKCLIRKNKKQESVPAKMNFQLFTDPLEHRSILDVDPEPEQKIKINPDPEPEQEQEQEPEIKITQEPEIKINQAPAPKEFDDICEIDINAIQDLETMTLKKPDEIYYKIYKEAKKKAKQAKTTALIAFMEAKNIKKTYLLNDIEDSDSDIDLTDLE